ncbi:hypothetical protein LJC27_06650 [Christensenellaceae bacterium OttesenSCG-928-M15]|nr:hypothetical protein [Christensenellaceae bacterium OttesenSCG-928-M15]
MTNYPAMYQKLFAAQADLIDELQAITSRLIEVHREVEEMYMESGEKSILEFKGEDA